MVTSPSTTPKGLTNGTNVDSRAATTPASTPTLPPSQSSAATTPTTAAAGVTGPTATTGGASASGGSNRLSPNICVNQVHHLHPNVSNKICGVNLSLQKQNMNHF